MDPTLLSGFMDDFLLNVDQTIFQVYQSFYATGTGNIPVLGGITSITAMMLAPLIIVLVIQVMHLAFEWVQNHHLEPRYVLEIIKIFCFIGAMMFVSKWGDFRGSTLGSIQNRAIGGLSVQGLLATADAGKAQAQAAIAALDVIMVYEEQLHGANGAGNARYKAVLDTLRKGNPSLDTVLTARDNAAAGHGAKDFGTIQKMGFAVQAVAGQSWTAIKNIASNLSLAGFGPALATSGISLIVGMLGKVAVYAFYLAAIYVTYFFFALSTMKALLIFWVYLKIAIVLAFILIPPAIGMAYFSPLRGIAMNVVKQLLVLIMLASAYGKAYQSIFSAENLQQVVTIALSSGAAGDIADAAHNTTTMTTTDAMATVVTEIMGSDNFGKKAEQTQAVAYFAALDITTIRAVFLAISRGVMMLGMMVVLLGRVYEIIGGALEGGFDPADLLRRQAMETHANMGASGGK